MKIKSLFHAALGITTEVLYAVSIMLGALLICIALYLKK